MTSNHHEDIAKSVAKAWRTHLSRILSLTLRQKNIQYTTSFNLPPGKYHLKFVVRENQTGRMGSFEAEIAVLVKAPLAAPVASRQ